MARKVFGENLWGECPAIIKAPNVTIFTGEILQVCYATINKDSKDEEVAFVTIIEVFENREDLQDQQ